MKAAEMFHCTCGWKYHPEDPNARDNANHHQARCNGTVTEPLQRIAEVP
jgi:hypothetical protein